ncbi:Protein of unknown function DUF4803 [Trinorchestia longiramus]|nr:Protein of unknown function DUF4803 [Trinorchestia longiramus]
MRWHGWAGFVSMILVAFCLVSAVAEESDEPQSKSVQNDGFYQNAVFRDFLSPSELGVLGDLAKLVGLSELEVVAMVNIVKMGLGVVDFINKIYSQVFNGSSLEVDLQSLAGTDRSMLAMFQVLSYRLEQIQLGLQGIERSLRDMARGLPHMLRWEVMLDSLEDYTRPVNSLYHRFVQYQRRKDEVEEHTLLDFAESVVSHDATSVLNLMANIHNMVAPDYPPVPTTQLLTRVGPEYTTVREEVSRHYHEVYMEKLRKANPSKNRIFKRNAPQVAELSLRPSVFKMLEQVIEGYDRCELHQSAQQMLFGLYSLVTLTQARGYAMVNYAYMLLNIYGKGNFTMEQELSRTLYEHYSRNTAHTALKVIARASNNYSRCDPLEHVQGDTYVMFTELLQGHIENEVDLNARSTCWSKCSSYEHARVQGCYAGDEQICGHRKSCQGTLHECRFFNADADVCYSSNPYRRYDWLHYENGITLGQRDACDDLEKVDSWWRFMVHCSYCMCLCDDPSSDTSDRYISLLPTETDIDDGMVLTGVKLSKHNRVIMIEVQQGRAMPQGQIDPSSLNWIDVPPINVNSPSFVEGRDYHTLTYESRSIDLDVLQAPAGHVITGVRFRILGSHANLEVRVTPINFIDGLLSGGLSYWISNDNTPVMASSPRKELLLYRPDDPSKSVTPSLTVITICTSSFRLRTWCPTCPK